jgi:hypothetical protein
MSETLKALQQFRDIVVNEAKANLRSQGKDASGKLSNSIQGEVKQMPNSIGVYFNMEPYGNFQDKGVKGANPSGLPNGSKNKGVQKAPNSPYKFGSGSGPKGGLTKSLDKWIVRKGIAPRDLQGKFQSRKTLKFLLARSIYMSGIKPSLFFTKPFEKAFKTLPDVLIDKYGLDAEQLLTQILDTNLKNIK